MNHRSNFVERAELAAQTTIKDWIRKALRESFLQALRQAWSVRYHQAEDGGNEIQVELSMSGVNACFSLVERVSRVWQTKLIEEHHERVAQWVAEVYQQGKSRLWVQQRVDDHNGGGENNHLHTSDKNKQLLKCQREKKDSRHQEVESIIACSGKEWDTSQGSNETFEEKLPSSVAKKGHYQHHPNVYCTLRALGRKLKLDSQVLSIPDALHEIKEFTRNHTTYWPLDNDIIDQACFDLSCRMRARDKHGSGGADNAGDGSKSYKKKAVRFKVLPKSVWETQQQERSQTKKSESNKHLSDGDKCSENNKAQTTTVSTQDNDQESKVETVLLAHMKRKKSCGRSYNPLQAAQKKPRMSKQLEIPRVPFDVPQSYDGKIRIDFSLEDMKVLDGLLILDDEQQDDNRTQPATVAILEAPLGLFGGLQHVGQTNYIIQNPGMGSFMARDTDKITRRKEKVSVQERLDPNRIEVGRTENPEKRTSKFLRTEDWFDDQKKFFDFDLGWCLLEITTEGNSKRLCAFSSMEICLEDRDW